MMYPAPFDYVRPATIDEAIALLVQHGDDAKLLAGGHSLIPAMKLRLARPTLVVDIGRIAGLSGIREADGVMAVGSMTTHAEIEASALLRSRCPLLPETASHIGDVQVRNKGTIGGSLVHADPAADWPAAILALDAELVIVGRAGRRTVRADGFFTGLMQTVVGSDEILAEIRVATTLASVAYVKTEQKASGFALAGVAAVLDRSSRSLRVGVAGVAATPYRAGAVERALAGGAWSAEAVAKASAHAADGVHALGDIHASPEFRAHLAEVNTRRALTLALERAG
jgi:carbon-monoxide dehydrogenase medium subunit